MDLPDIDLNTIGWPGALVITVLVAAFVIREVFLGKTLREVKHQVKNSHQTNLRDDVTDIQDAILGPPDPFDLTHRRRIEQQGLHGMVTTLSRKVTALAEQLASNDVRITVLEDTAKKE